MNDVLIFQHTPLEGPGTLGTLLHERGVPYRILRMDLGDPVPEGVGDARALVFMGGPMSVNDEAVYPWLGREMALIREAVGAGLPTLGHCLGGQLIAKAMGATVTRNKVPEIGWHEVAQTEAGADSPWLAGLPSRFTLFHWHGETFTLPDGAVHLLWNENCDHQAFAIGHHCLALQCHPEVTPDMVRDWTQGMADDLACQVPTVQDGAALLEDLEERCGQLASHACVLYQPWLAML